MLSSPSLALAMVSRIEAVIMSAAVLSKTGSGFIKSQASAAVRGALKAAINPPDTANPMSAAKTQKFRNNLSNIEGMLSAVTTGSASQATWAPPRSIGSPAAHGPVAWVKTKKAMSPMAERVMVPLSETL